MMLPDESMHYKHFKVTWAVQAAEKLKSIRRIRMHEKFYKNIGFMC